MTTKKSTENADTVYEDPKIFIQMARDHARDIRKRVCEAVTETSSVIKIMQEEVYGKKFISRWEVIAVEEKIGELMIAQAKLAEAYQAINKTACP